MKNLKLASRTIAARTIVAVGNVRGGGFVARYNQAHAKVIAQAFQRFQKHHVRAVGDGVDVFHALGV